MNVSILLVDDDAFVRNEMRTMLAPFDTVTVAGEADGIKQALSFIRHTQVDAVISDIQMPDGSGFDLAKQIHAIYPRMPIVFLTGYAHFALAGYEYGPVDFLVKPVDSERLALAIRRITDRLCPEDEKKRDVFVGISGESGYQIINVRKILYLEKEQRKVLIQMNDGSQIATGQSMKDLESIFEPYDFIRCHQGYIVPLGAIKSLQKDPVGRSYLIALRNTDIAIPISRRKYAEIKDILEQYGIHCY